MEEYEPEYMTKDIEESRVQKILEEKRRKLPVKVSDKEYEKMLMEGD